MRFIVLASEKDLAGKNIFNKLKIRKKLIGESSIYAENIDKNLEEDFIIFASKHKSKKGKPSLTVHAPGNWGEAKFGGRKERVCNTSSLFLKKLFQNLNIESKGNQNYQATLEVTHHGPYIKKPCCFIEIGSSKKEWEDNGVGEIIAKTIEKTISGFKPKNPEAISAVGIGGPHYCPSFNKIQLKSRYALGHIIPQYVFPINKKIILEAINKTMEKPELAVIDWKGLKSRERRETIKILKEISLPYKRSSDIKNYNLL